MCLALRDAWNCSCLPQCVSINVRPCSTTTTTTLNCLSWQIVQVLLPELFCVPINIWQHEFALFSRVSKSACFLSIKSSAYLIVLLGRHNSHIVLVYSFFLVFSLLFAPSRAPLCSPPLYHHPLRLPLAAWAHAERERKVEFACVCVKLREKGVHLT